MPSKLNLKCMCMLSTGFVLIHFAFAKLFLSLKFNFYDIA